MIDRPTASPTILQPRSSKWDSSTNIRTDPAWPQNTATLSCTSGMFSHSVRSLILRTLEDTGWLIGEPDGGRQSSIRFDPFSPLHHQCVAWMLSGLSSLQALPICASRKPRNV
jgi:hypothetical protein